MAGRIEIDDVAPVVSGGRFPAKAVVGEVVPVRATVWREGHDAVAATLVVRYHGTAYPRLARDARGRATSRLEPVPIETVVGAAAADQAAAAADGAGRHPRRVPRPVHPRRRRAVDLPGGRLGRPDRARGARRHRQARGRPGRVRTVQRPADRRAAARARRDRRAASGSLSADRRGGRDCARPAIRSPGQAPRSPPRSPTCSTQYPLRELVTRGEQYGVWVDRPLARFSAWYELFPRSTGGWDADGQRRCTARSPRRPRRCRASRRWASTSSTCRRSTRSARCTARAATTA